MKVTETRKIVQTLYKRSIVETEEGCTVRIQYVASFTYEDMDTAEKMMKKVGKRWEAYDYNMLQNVWYAASGKAHVHRSQRRAFMEHVKKGRGIQYKVVDCWETVKYFDIFPTCEELHRIDRRQNERSAYTGRPYVLRVELAGHAYLYHLVLPYRYRLVFGGVSSLKAA